MKIWPVQDAKSRFSELLDACASEGPRMVSAARPSLKSLLLSGEGRFGLDLPPRGQARRRTVTEN